VNICWLDGAINTIYLFIFLGALFQAADEKCFQRRFCLFLFAIKTYTLKKNSTRCAAANLRLGSRFDSELKYRTEILKLTKRQKLNERRKQTRLKQLRKAKRERAGAERALERERGGVPKRDLGGKSPELSSHIICVFKNKKVGCSKM